MKFIRIATVVILILLNGCTSTGTSTNTITTPVESDSNLITCIHEYEPSWRFTFERGNVSRYMLNNVVQFHIIDTDGRDVFLNIYEIENYNCE
jgi:hypothetical protein